jgi:transcriptional regulator with XRE-family HTH domain
MPKVDAERLRYEMATRGLLGRDLARLAKIDANTISRALSGRPVTTRTLMRIIVKPASREGASETV